MQLSHQQYTHIGQRDNNEDCIVSISETGVFAVCDGVGGAAKGEIASQLTCNQISDYYKSNDTTNQSREEFNKLIQLCTNTLKRYAKENPGSSGMATTLAFLKLNGNSAFVAHIGDSRVYHIRNGEVLFQTSDHSYVNELVKEGLITPEQARFHPEKNIITKVLGTGNNTGKADQTELNNIIPGDFFMLCTDGVIEVISDWFISTIFKTENSVGFIMNEIKKLGEKFASDNNSAIIIKVKSI